MTVRELIDQLHRELLKSFPRGPKIDQWSRAVTKADVATIKSRVGTIADTLFKES